MPKRKAPVPSAFAGREQTHMKKFLLQLFEEGRPAEEAVRVLRSRFDADDFARVRALGSKLGEPAPKDARGPRTKT